MTGGGRSIPVLAVVAALGVVATAAAVAGPARPAAAEPRAAACITPEGEVAVGQVLVVVAFPSRSVSACVAPGGNGIEVLRAAGFSVETVGYGSVGGAAAVCAIGHPTTEQVGCATGPSCLTCGGRDYWQYYRCWAYSPAGGGSTRPGGGTIEGWRWGSSTGWPVAGRPAACDSDGDDVVTPVAPPPTAPPPSRPGPGGPSGSAPGGPARPPGPAGEAPGPGEVPRSGGDPDPAPDGTDPADPADPTDPGSEPTSPAEDGTTTASGPGSDAPTSSDDRERTGRSRSDGGDEDAVAALAPDRQGSSGTGGSAARPLLITAALVAILGVVAVRLRRRRAATAIAGTAPQR